MSFFLLSFFFFFGFGLLVSATNIPPVPTRAPRRFKLFVNTQTSPHKKTRDEPERGGVADGDGVRAGGGGTGLSSHGPQQPRAGPGLDHAGGTWQQSAGIFFYGEIP